MRYLNPRLSIAKETLNKWLRGRIAALRGARSLAYLLICLGRCAPCALRFLPLADFFSVSLT
jgi:hypothetical protein